MKKLTLNKRGNSMPHGRKSIKLFYQEMIDESEKNIGRETEFGTIIDEKFIETLKLRLKELTY